MQNKKLKQMYDIKAVLVINGVIKTDLFNFVNIF